MADSVPIWQAALLTQGCQVQVGGQFFPLELRPVNDRIFCTPSVSGSLLPFNVSVKLGESVTIAWNAELSRYVVTAGGLQEAA